MSHSEQGQLGTGCGTLPLNPPTLIVDEVLDSDKGFAKGSVRTLMSALLFDGVQAYLTYVSSTAPQHKSYYKEAFNWVNKAGGEYIFSFDNVCDALGINPEYLRCGLINVAKSQVFEWKRVRKTF